MSSIAVLYGTTADDNVRPVLCNDSGQLVTDQSGGTNWYENLYVGGTSGNPPISLLSDGSATFAGGITSYPSGASYAYQINDGNTNLGGLYKDTSSSRLLLGTVTTTLIDLKGSDGSAEFAGEVTVDGSVYAKAFIDSDGYDVGKIGQALSTIHDVIESVDDLQGLKNLFHLLLDNLKSDPTPPTPPSSETPSESPE